MKRKAILQLVIILMIIVYQPMQAQARDATSVNQGETEVQQLRSKVEELKTNNEQLRSDVAQLHLKVISLESENNRATAGFLSFLSGAFCALWAQNTRRNAWLWFFLGFIFNVITLLFLLRINSQTQQPPHSG